MLIEHMRLRKKPGAYVFATTSLLGLPQLFQPLRVLVKPRDLGISRPPALLGPQLYGAKCEKLCQYETEDFSVDLVLPKEVQLQPQLVGVLNSTCIVWFGGTSWDRFR